MDMNGKYRIDNTDNISEQRYPKNGAHLFSAGSSRGASEEAFQAPLFDEFVCALDIEVAKHSFVRDSWVCPKMLGNSHVYIDLITLW